MTMRDYINIVEAVEPNGKLYMHVTSAKNLRSILSNGLVANHGGRGNYEAYETSLEGVYVTRLPEIIKHHIFAREIENDFVIAVVQVGTTALIDEDVLDEYLQDAFKKAGGYKDDYRLAASASKMVRLMLPKLGPPDPKMKAGLKALLIEFCQAWLDEQIEGGDSGADGDWWQETKDRIIRSFPKLSHPQHGNDFSLRIPMNTIGYEGDTRIVAVVRMKDQTQKIVKGQVPPEAQIMINKLVEP